MQKAQSTEVPLWRRVTGGAALVAFGAAMLAISWSYPAGTVVQMGPGYMPHLISAGIMLFGAVIVLADLRGMEAFDAGPMQFRALGFVSAAIAIFVVLIEPAGLVPAMFCAVAVSMLADNRTRLPGILIYSSAVTLAGWFLFIVALGLPLSVFGR
ncbi:tripartite tricarboxylate transporter TctB family protein [Oricola thermophila]|uniref:Tripartite tricarboxylate transporter TctB family protein n=1 Tax=Oricola thermophila TaxID=2742145 RepID=A0A6N1VH79_9HYPH|nr:tripartite tricarboxylate transporter TctB family protein [Oricola thermophila]QKV20164.1 tripartite tricarboxylate transporter TctB family protein [Oricola thermophila]